MAADLRRKQVLGELAERILSACQDIGAMDPAEHVPLPCREAVVEIAEGLKQVLFAGPKVKNSSQLASARYQAGSLLNKLHDALTEQVAWSLQHDRRLQMAAKGSIDFEGLAQDKTLAFLEGLPRLRTILALDAQSALDGDPAASGIDEILLCYPGMEAVTVYRLAHELFKLEVPLIPRMLTEWTHTRTGIDIHPGAQIGSSFFIDHGTGVVIGATCEIADNVKLYQGVTLGALSFPRDDEGRIIRGRKRHPTIEENVVIYANATVLGGTTVVGAGSIIGASVSLTRSVPPNTVVTIDNKPSLRFRQAS